MYLYGSICVYLYVSVFFRVCFALAVTSLIANVGQTPMTPEPPIREDFLRPFSMNTGKFWSGLSGSPGRRKETSYWVFCWCVRLQWGRFGRCGREIKL